MNSPEIPDIALQADYVHDRKQYIVLGVGTRWQTIPEQVLEQMERWYWGNHYPADEPTQRAKFLQLMARYDNQAQAALLTSGLYDA